MATPPNKTTHLVLSARDGDVQAFNRLYERLAPSLYTWAEIRMGARLRGWLDPADLVQEVWTRALRSVGDLDPHQVSFRFWIFRIAKHALLEALRRSESRGAGARQSTRPYDSDPLAELPDSVTAVSRRMARDEDLGKFRQWLDELSDSDRELVIHVGLEDMAHAKVALRLDLEPKAVTKRWQRLRERLQASGQLLEILEE